MTNPEILCDTDFLYALLDQDDSNHSKAINIFRNHFRSKFIHLDIIKMELMTVLSRRLQQKDAILALELFEDTFTDNLILTENNKEKVVAFYKQSQNKNQSFFDIANLIIAEKNGYKIASFDKFYPKDILVKYE